MGIKKMKSEGDSGDELSIPLGSSAKPVYVPLKQILMVVLALGFIYQTSNVYHDSLVNNTSKVEKWETCLSEYVTNLCSPLTTKETPKEVKACKDAYDCLLLGVKHVSWMNLGY